MSTVWSTIGREVRNLILAGGWPRLRRGGAPFGPVVTVVYSVGDIVSCVSYIYYIHGLQNSVLYTGDGRITTCTPWRIRSAILMHDLQTLYLGCGMGVESYTPKPYTCRADFADYRDPYKNELHCMSSDTKARFDAEYYRGWRRKHPDYYKAKVRCQGCGAMIRRSGLSEHRLSNKHLRAVANQHHPAAQIPIATRPRESAA